jgi:hypothetical protein
MCATFEQYLGPALSSSVGPLVALGNPTDHYRPEGAARNYASDDEWQSEFLRLAQLAAAIVMEASVSDKSTLLWELREIESRGWSHKLFVITRPLPMTRSRIAEWAFAGLRWAKHIQRPTWRRFASYLSTAHLRIDNEPDPGSVVGFDSNAHGVVLTVGAQTPEDFVVPIQRWLRRPNATA